MEEAKFILDKAENPNFEYAEMIYKKEVIKLYN